MASEADSAETTARLMSRPGYMFRRCSQAAGGLFERACRDLGLTTGQYDVLFILSLERSVDQDRLALLLGLDRSTTGVLAGNLERKGLIKRTVKPTDRRKRMLAMTDDGRDLFKSAEPMAEAAKAKILAPLTEEEADQPFALMRRIVNSVATDAPPE